MPIDPPTPAEPGDEVWDNENTPGPHEGNITVVRFESFSDPGVLVSYQEGEGEYDRFGQHARMRFSAPRFIALEAYSDGIGITTMEVGDGAGTMVGNALMWLALQFLRRPDAAAFHAANYHVTHQEPSL